MGNEQNLYEAYNEISREEFRRAKSTRKRIRELMEAVISITKPVLNALETYAENLRHELCKTFLHNFKENEPGRENCETDEWIEYCKEIQSLYSYRCHIVKREKVLYMQLYKEVTTSVILPKKIKLWKLHPHPA